MSYPTDVSPEDYADLREIAELTGRGAQGGPTGAVPNWDRFTARSLQGLQARLHALDSDPIAITGETTDEVVESLLAALVTLGLVVDETGEEE